MGAESSCPPAPSARTGWRLTKPPAGGAPIPQPGGPSGAPGLPQGAPRGWGRRARPSGSSRSRAAWKTLHGCRPGGVARSSGGGPGGGRAGQGDGPATKRALFCAPPRELEPMDWRQLRSSVRQRRGSGPGKGPRGRAGRMAGGGPCVRAGG